MASHGVPRVPASAIDKSEQAREKERKQIERYKQLETDVTARIQAHDYSAETLHQTSALLAQNPEYYTIWNWRRQLLLDVFSQELNNNNNPNSSASNNSPPTTTTTTTDPNLTPAQSELSLLISEDLAFLLPLLKQYPKCYWIWNHRSWLLQTGTTHLPVAASLRLWHGELKLVGKMLDLDARNFHGWGYRREVVGNIEALMGQQQEQQEQQQQTPDPARQTAGGPAAPPTAAAAKASTSMVESEFDYTTAKIGANLSNFSAWHYRSQLLPRLLAERHQHQHQLQHEPLTQTQRAKELLHSESALLEKALFTDPYDQSLWSYHRFLVAVVAGSGSGIPEAEVGLGVEIGGGKQTRAQGLERTLELEAADRAAFLRAQMRMLRELRADADDCKFVLLALLEVGGWLAAAAAGEGEGEGEVVTKQEMREWLAGVRELDPLREGRWRDLRGTLGL